MYRIFTEYNGKKLYYRRCTYVENQPFAFYGDGEIWEGNYETASFIANQNGGKLEKIS